MRSISRYPETLGEASDGNMAWSCGNPEERRDRGSTRTGITGGGGGAGASLGGLLRAAFTKSCKFPRRLDHSGRSGDSMGGPGMGGPEIGCLPAAHGGERPGWGGRGADAAPNLCGGDCIPFHTPPPFYIASHSGVNKVQKL
eukprot:Hpha_TRINITY_DN16341_c1_g21::TRINITY_DN16341_c1_g21_i1::g.59808::m.59808